MRGSGGKEGRGTEILRAKMFREWQMVSESTITVPS